MIRLNYDYKDTVFETRTDHCRCALTHFPHVAVGLHLALLCLAFFLHVALSAITSWKEGTWATSGISFEQHTAQIHVDRATEMLLTSALMPYMPVTGFLHNVSPLGPPM